VVTVCFNDTIADLFSDPDFVLLSVTQLTGSLIGYIDRPCETAASERSTQYLAATNVRAAGQFDDAQRHLSSFQWIPRNLYAAV
jgi:hypothetical protein